MLQTLNMKSMEVVMATMFEGRVNPAHLQRQTVTSAVYPGATCMRCGGLMVNDFCMALLNSAGDLEVVAKRCVQCGEVVDPVIERNRRVRQEEGTIRPLERSVQSRACQVRS